jgi:hypothetical protein
MAHKEPKLVEYLLRLVWDHEEYELLLRGGRAAVESLDKAGLTPEQQKAVEAALKGDRRQLDVEVAKECKQFSGQADVLWNGTTFIFGKGTGTT